MALQSKLFKGDQRLEACLVHNAAVMSLPGFTGSITLATLAGMQFGGPFGGRALFDSEPVTFD